jgi:cytoskeletal protein RodZ
MNELGQMLREAREAKGISLVEAEEFTKIRRKYLQALEESDYEALPPNIYARGFLRNYATYLGLNPNEVLVWFSNGIRPGGQPAEPRIISEPLVPSPRISWEFIAGIVMLAVVGVLLVFIYRRYIAPLAAGPAAPTPTVAQALGINPLSLPGLGASDDPTPTPTLPPSPIPPSATPTDEPTAAPTATPAVIQELVLQLAATADAWVRVTADGEIVFEGVLAPGEQRTWPAQQEIFLRAGNAGGLIASVSDQNVGVLGTSGEVRNLVWRLSEDGKVLSGTPTP